MDLKKINPLWRLADTLTVNQASALIAGVDPSSVRFDEAGLARFANDSSLTDAETIRWVETAFSALRNAINAGTLPAKIQPLMRLRQGNEKPQPGELLHVPGSDHWSLRDVPQPVLIVGQTPDWNVSTVSVEDLREWLKRASMCTGFFFPTGSGIPDYLDPANSRYAPKLAAAVSAWCAVRDPGGKHPKGALLKWLREHAAEYGLTDDDGKLNEQGIEEAAKVANWQPGGGAPKTPVA